MMEDREKMKGIRKSKLKSTIEFLRMGGKLEARYTKMEDIAEAVKSRNPPIILIERKSLYGNDKGEKIHYVMVMDIDNKTMTIKDPDPVYGGLKRYPKDDIVFAFYSQRGFGLFPKPKK